MVKLALRFEGDPVLRQICKSVEKIEKRHLKLANGMVELMYEKGGIGLAAPQVGVSERIVVFDTEWIKSDDAEFKPYLLFNPEIDTISSELVSDREGCLSLPGHEGMVDRALWVAVKYKNHAGKEQIKRFEGLDARCVQHEIDHLDGILFLDHLK